MVSGAGIREIGILASFAFPTERAARSQAHMDPSINSQSFRVGPFDLSPAELAKQSAVQREAITGGSCNAVSCPIVPRARVEKRVIHRDPTTEEYVVLELPVSDAKKLRALLGSLGVGSSIEERFLRTLGRFPCKPGIAGIAGPDAQFFTESEVSNAAVITHTALRKAGL